MEDPQPPIHVRGFFHVGYPADVDVLGIVAARGVVDLLGEANARELLGILELPDNDQANFIAQTSLRDKGQSIANVLGNVERDPGDPVRLRLIGGLRRVLSGNA